MACGPDWRVRPQHLYPQLGVDLEERAYGVDCRLWVPGQGVNWPVIRATVFDEFVVAHTLGWWAKVRWGGSALGLAANTVVRFTTLG